MDHRPKLKSQPKRYKETLEKLWGGGFEDFSDSQKKTWWRGLHKIKTSAFYNAFCKENENISHRPRENTCKSDIWFYPKYIKKFQDSIIKKKPKLKWGENWIGEFTECEAWREVSTGRRTTRLVTGKTERKLWRRAANPSAWPNLWPGMPDAGPWGWSLGHRSWEGNSHRLGSSILTPGKSGTCLAKHWANNVGSVFVLFSCSQIQERCLWQKGGDWAANPNPQWSGGTPGGHVWKKKSRCLHPDGATRVRSYKSFSLWKLPKNPQKCSIVTESRGAAARGGGVRKGRRRDDKAHGKTWRDVTPSTGCLLQASPLLCSLTHRCTHLLGGFSDRLHLLKCLTPLTQAGLWRASSLPDLVSPQPLPEADTL